MNKVIEARVCPECGEPFTPLPRRDGTFPVACKPCIRKFNGKQRRGHFPEAFRTALVRKKQAARARVEASLRGQFGLVSERDAAIFSFGVSVGYGRGYDSAYHAQRKSG